MKGYKGICEKREFRKNIRRIRTVDGRERR